MKRRRITMQRVTQHISDPLDFVVNNASNQARSLEFRDVGFNIAVYGDKHYILRFSTEDNTGERRFGITIRETLNLIFKTIKHILYYIFKIDNFNPINFPSSKLRNQRIVLIDKLLDQEDLNVVVEIHFDNIETYEFTIITAMRVDDFNIGDGQYIIEMTNNSSVLKQFVRGTKKVVDDFDN
ncbi:hypothetical protein HX071_01390 [Myroides marinus]|uniref:hypothetical protein n=1 Tax=Myroides marinus TaxID=703342 RepID=UPI002578243C|nr:hypothetical protein [Myroides marinus]MDM1362474.1 hypothetical protein [Myroides marinus]MDM1500860.1 hypothetical protein [Myroides marinus]